MSICIFPIPSPFNKSSIQFSTNAVYRIGASTAMSYVLLVLLLLLKYNYDSCTLLTITTSTATVTYATSIIVLGH